MLAPAILYHEYIVDHFTTTLSAMLEKYLPSRLKQILPPTRLVLWSLPTSPRLKRHKRRWYCEGIITGTFFFFCMKAVCLLLFTISNLNPLSASSPSTKSRLLNSLYQVDWSVSHNGKRKTKEAEIEKESEESLLNINNKCEWIFIHFYTRWREDTSTSFVPTLRVFLSSSFFRFVFNGWSEKGAGRICFMVKFP